VGNHPFYPVKNNTKMKRTCSGLKEILIHILKKNIKDRRVEIYECTLTIAGKTRPRGSGVPAFQLFIDQA
jgi:hypothetical protein